MRVTIGNWSGSVIRILVLGIMVWLSWGVNPVVAANYVVTTTAAASIGYVCDNADNLSGGYYSIGNATELRTFAGIINKTGNPSEVVFVDGSGTAAASLDLLKLTSNAKLTADIALWNTTNWAEWGSSPPTGATPWIPIGNKDNKYAGTFDGAGFTVSGIYINNAQNDQGLFGAAKDGSMIKNLGVTASYIKGGDEVGGIVGNMTGSISNCYNSATISGKTDVGGLTGYSGSTKISNSYNTGKITGTSYVGGLSGKDVASDAYKAKNCFYLTGTAARGVGNYDDVVGKTEVRTEAAFAAGEVAYLLNQYNTPTAYPEGWLHWTQNPGAATPSFALAGTNIIDKKITLNYQDPTVDLVFYGAKDSTIIGLPAAQEGYIYTYTSDSIVYSQAEMASYRFTDVDDLVFAVKKYQLAVNEEGVIEIDTAVELTEFSRYVNDGNSAVNGQLTADIALREDTTGWAGWGELLPADTTQWIPIGTDSKPYAGTFDGAGFTVSGLYINTGSPDQGLFGNCSSSAIIKDLKVMASYIKGSFYTGGIVGRTEGTITNCQVEATLDGGVFVGGVAGRVGTITGSSYTGSVTGAIIVGGVAGNVSSSISNCYNTGSVKGKSYTGGIVGGSDGSLAGCYNTGMVTGSDRVTGAIVGQIVESANRTNCYYLTESTVFGDPGTPASGIGYPTKDIPGQIEPKPAAAFASGEIAWRLQNAQTDLAVPVWGQQLGEGGEALPLLKTSDRVYQLTLNKGDGSLYSQSYRNAIDTPLDSIDGITWKDAGGTAYTTITEAADHTLTPWLTTVPTTLPTATAVYGTKLGDITLSGTSVPEGSWNWPDAEKNQILPVGNDRGFSARYIASDDPRGITDVAITPEITARSLTAPEVAVSPPANANYTGAEIKPPITVSDSRAAITADDYTVTYTNNTSPGTATVTISGQHNYQGEVSRTFTITASGGGGYTPPAMSGITVTPHAISFDTSGQIAVDISGLPPGATVFYSLDGSSFSTTAPAITGAGEYPLYLRISCPGYQDYTTQTTVMVAKQEAPLVSPITLPLPPQQQQQQPYTLLLGQGLPADRGQTGYQLGTVDDPGGLLDGPPSIAADGTMTCNFRRSLLVADGTSQPALEGLQTAASTATITVLVTMANYEDTTLTVVVSGAEPLGLRYLTHIQDYGWESDWVTAGELSGTTGQSKRLEALKVELTGDVPAGAKIETAVHVQDLGDLGPFAMGSAAGTSGQSRRLENICLTLQNLPGYSLRYNVHVQDQGWLRDEADPSSWFSSGEVAGTSGKSRRLEAIRMVLVKDE